MKYESYSMNPFGKIISADMVIRPLNDESEIVNPSVVITTQNIQIECPIVEFKSHQAVDSIEVSLSDSKNGNYGKHTESLGKGVYLKHDGIYPTAIFFGPDVDFPNGEPPVFGVMGFLGHPVKDAIKQQMFDGGKQVSSSELKEQNQWSTISEIKK